MWFCACGYANEGKFCTACGRADPTHGDAKPSPVNHVQTDTAIKKEDLAQDSRNFLRNTFVHVRGKPFQVAKIYLALTCALILCLASVTVISYLIGNVSLICAAGLLWVMFLMLVFNIMKVMHWIAGALRKWSNWLAEHLETTVAEVNTLADAALKIPNAIFMGIEKFIYASMAVIALCVEGITRLHMHLANSAIYGEHHAPELRFDFKTALYSAGLLSAGGLASLMHNWRRARDIRDKFALLRISPEKIIEFLSSFEFFRCLLILFTGLWGLSAFRCVSTMLNIPSDDGSIILLANHARRQASYDLYVVQGWFLYNLLFVIVPIGFVVASFIHKRHSKEPGYKPIFGLQHHAAATTAVLLLILALNVWYRAGIIPRYIIAFTHHYRDEALGKQLSSCLLSSHDPESDYSCMLHWNHGLEEQLNRLDVAAETRILPKNKAPYDQIRNEWRVRELEARIKAFEQYPEPYEKTLALMLRGDAIETQIAHLNMIIAAPATQQSPPTRRRRG